MVSFMNFRMPTDEEIQSAFEKGEAAVRDLFRDVAVQVEELARQLATQGEALQALQARLAKDSRTSGKPPSSDGYSKAKRTQSLRQSGNKPNGGQPGHEEHTLHASAHPDRTETHEAITCAHCQAPLADTEATGYEERQVFDIPAIRLEVTAYRAEVTLWPHCGGKTTGACPAGGTQAVQYGPTVKAWAAYFPNQHHIPVERTVQIFEDVVHQPVSEATVLQASEDVSQCIEPSTEAVQEMLRDSEVLHVDESGLRVKGKLHWLHVASIDHLTHYTVHAKRGQEAMEAAGILGAFNGTAVHDHWKPYFTYEECRQALCNAHHLRELQCIEQQYEQAWTNDMAELLLEIKVAVEETRVQAASVPPEWLEAFERRYDAIVQEGCEANPLPPPPAHAGTATKRGRPKHTPPWNLLMLQIFLSVQAVTADSLCSFSFQH
jgi:transposase